VAFFRKRANHRLPNVVRVLTFVLPLLALGLLTGVTTVLFGFGGGFVVVPVVYHVTRAQADPGVDPMAVAVATSTAVMVVNALSATLSQHRAGRLRRDYVWPLAAYIGVGAVLGSLVATAVGGGAQRVLFIAYIAVTLLDTLLRKGFLTRDPDAGPRLLGRRTTTAGGVGIGAVTSFLGVGGSVMTVPLLRRRGLPMGEATAMANPLSLPVAVAGTAVYALFGEGGGDGPGHLGSVDLVAGALLLAGSLPAIAVTRRLVGRVPDRVHAVSYVVLLAVVLAAFVLM
jgi:uncharacterized membrane protein YfcA